MVELLSGNEAIARGAYEAGVTLASGYPGTPSTEILEALVALRPRVYCEWSPNEKVALEVAAGASLAGARCIVTMKHVGLNVAADPLMTLAYIGTVGGLVLCVGDDPGMHSSQNEQDTRHFARFAKVPIFEPSDSQEAKEFTALALEVSERFTTPVILRTTTRVSHSRSLVSLGDRVETGREIRFEKDPPRFVPIPLWGRVMRVKLEDRLAKLRDLAGHCPANRIEWADRDWGVLTSSIAYQYVREVFPQASVLKLGLSFPFPDDLIRQFAAGVKRVLVVEELDDILEEHVRSLGIACVGRQFVPGIGELSPGRLAQAKAALEGKSYSPPAVPAQAADLPARPPVLCPGCPHRSVFHALAQRDVIVTGDIGCYSLGVFKPLSRIDTILCMGGGITLAHGMDKAGEKRKVVGIVGDSTFFHSGVTGLMNIVYNRGVSTIIVVDNRTTAMTGHQDHPGTGQTLMGEKTFAASIQELAKACGVRRVRTVDPYDLKSVREALDEELAADEPSLIVSSAPCVLQERKRPGPRKKINPEICTKCGLCLRLGCPAAEGAKGAAPIINEVLCAGCGMCQQVCKFGAIVEMEEGLVTAEGTISVVLAGVGGQGILLASEVVARCAMHAGFDVKTNEVHGMAQRGGSVIAQVRYGRKVHSPLVCEGTAAVLGAMEQIEALRFAHFLAPGGLAVVSSQAIIPVTVSSGQAGYPTDVPQRLAAVFPRRVYLQADKLAASAGNVRAANLVILGAMSNGLELPAEAWQEAIRGSVAPKYLDVNLRAFELWEDDGMSAMFNEKAETASPDELRGLQFQRLGPVLRQAMKSPAHRRLFDEAGAAPQDIKRLDDVARLPLMDKEHFRKSYPLELCCVDSRTLVEMHMSSGSTGTPVVMPYTRADLDQWGECMARCLAMAGAGGDAIQITPSFGLFNGGFGFYHGARMLGMFVIPTGAGNTSRQIRLARDFKTRVLTGVVSYGIRIMEVLEEEKGSLPDLKIGIFGAETFSDSLKRKFVENLGIEVFDIYGMTETGGVGTLGMDCPAHQGTHVWEDHYFVEVLDERTHQPVPDGQLGELTVTSLTREALPVIRFRTGDLTRLVSRDRCACGRTHLRIAPIMGRVDDMLIVKGVNFFPKQVEQALMGIPGVRPNYQIIIEEVDGIRDVRINVEADPSVTGYIVEKHLKEALGFSPKGDVFAPGELPRQEGKAKRVFYKDANGLH